MANEYIRHQGKVERIENQKIYVRILQKAACSDCHAVAVCLASDKKEKIIEVIDDSGCFELQEDVFVSVRQSNGLFAVFIAYVLPLLIVIITVIIGISVSKDEAFGGFAGLVTLIPYYFIVYLMRDKLKKKFIFSLSKMTEPTHLQPM